MQELTNNTLLHGGTYRIIKMLGQGSFGITYLAEHTSLGKKVAIKEFFMKELNSRGEDGSITGMSDGSLSHNYGQKFKKETINLSRLEHPNIVRVTDSFDENGTYYYVMDYIDGCNLNDYLKNNSISPQEAVEIITDVSKALMYMHEEKHVLHLDLKPGNIMRRKSDGHIFLIDFGLSKHFSNDGQPETSTTIGLGTAGYAPVEQSNQAKNGEFRPTIDVYALGATLYKLLTGQTPPVASDLVSDDELLVESLAKYNVQGAIVDAIEKAMMPSVKKRTQSIRAFIDSLQGVNDVASSATTTNNIETEETEFIGKVEAGEETVFVSESIEKHPDFDESTYTIKTDYKNYPIITGNKANSNDREAMLALGVMALRGEGVQQDFDTAHAWFLKLKNLGDDRGEKIINQWTVLKDKYNTTKTGDKNSKTKTKSEDSGSGAIVGIVFLVVFVIIVIICAKGCGNKLEQASDYYAYGDTVDTVAVDTVAYEPVEDFSSGYHEVTYDDGSTYKGNFKNGERSGYGVYTWPEKRSGYMYKYEGNWQHGERNGKGTAYYVGGAVDKGMWKNGEFVEEDTNANLSSLERKIVGKHPLSLQWISWDYFGTVEISKVDANNYRCVGQQLSKEHPGDYLKLDGYISIVSELHLKFTGTIKTKIYHLNNGQEYVRQGTFDFKSTAGRKYWREQEMKGPDACDYVDIYMKKL